MDKLRHFHESLRYKTPNTYYPPNFFLIKTILMVMMIFGLFWSVYDTTHSILDVVEELPNLDASGTHAQGATANGNQDTVPSNQAGNFTPNDPTAHGDADFVNHVVTLHEACKDLVDEVTVTLVGFDIVALIMELSSLIIGAIGLLTHKVEYFNCFLFLEIIFTFITLIMIFTYDNSMTTILCFLYQLILIPVIVLMISNVLKIRKDERLVSERDSIRTVHMNRNGSS